MGNIVSSSISNIEQIMQEAFSGAVNEIKKEEIKFNKYGWKLSKPDERDVYFDFTLNKKNETNKDLRELCPPIYNQGELGSCTANAISFAYEFDQIKQKEQKKDVFIPSRLFIYYNERSMEGTVSSDSGAEIRDGIKSINKVGVCPESMWPYNINVFTEKPSNDCYEMATKHKSVKYARVKQTLEELRECVSSGFPIVFGFTVYESFESDAVAKTGIMPMPKKDESIVGGHAVSVVGFTDKTFIVRNSWGDSWGDKGYFYMPNEFITNVDYANDFWVIHSVHDTE